jgi:hypothetical protein
MRNTLEGKSIFLLCDLMEIDSVGTPKRGKCAPLSVGFMGIDSRGTL